MHACMGVGGHKHARSHAHVNKLVYRHAACSALHSLPLTCLPPRRPTPLSPPPTVSWPGAAQVRKLAAEFVQTLCDIEPEATQVGRGGGGGAACGAADRNAAEALRCCLTVSGLGTARPPTGPARPPLACCWQAQCGRELAGQLLAALAHFLLELGGGRRSRCCGNMRHGTGRERGEEGRP